MDKECKREIRKVLKKFHFSEKRTVEGALEDIDECVIEYRRRKRAREMKRRGIEAELRRAEKMKPMIIEPEKRMETLQDVPTMTDLTWMLHAL